MALTKLSALFLSILACGAFVAPARAADFPDVEVILGDLGKSAAGAGVEAVLGSFLSQYGLGAATAGQLDEVNARLDKISAKLDALESGQTDLAARIERSAFKAALTRTNAITAKIDAEFAEYQAIARLTDAGARERRTRALLGEIRSSIWSSLVELDKDISGVAGQTGLIAASSSVIRSEHRFFRNAQSLEARKVWHYFQYYEAIALLLLLEYRNAHPEDFPKAENEAFVTAERVRINGQKALLKPLVPPGLAIDTTTGLGWEFSTVNSHGRWLQKFPNNKVAMIDNELRIARYLYTRVPGTNDLASMLAGHSGDPIDWLHKEAGFPATMTPGDIGYAVWSNSGYWQEECQDIFQYFNCRDVAYTTAVVIRRECHSDPDHTVCDPHPGQAKNVRVEDAYRAGTIQMLFEPQNHWYYPAPPKAAKRGKKAKKRV